MRLLLALLLLAGCASAPRRAEDLVGAPLELDLVDLAGKRVLLDATRGKVILIELWASWCNSCAQGLAQTQELFAPLTERGLEVVGVALDEDLRPVAAFAEKAGARFPLLWDKGGRQSAAALGVERLPSLFVIDKQGVIRGAVSGPDAAKRAALAPLVHSLLEKP